MIGSVVGVVFSAIIYPRFLAEPQLAIALFLCAVSNAMAPWTRQLPAFATLRGASQLFLGYVDAGKQEVGYMTKSINK